MVIILLLLFCYYFVIIILYNLFPINDGDHRRKYHREIYDAEGPPEPGFDVAGMEGEEEQPDVIVGN